MKSLLHSSPLNYLHYPRYILQGHHFIHFISQIQDLETARSLKLLINNSKNNFQYNPTICWVGGSKPFLLSYFLLLIRGTMEVNSAMVASC